MFVRLPGLSFVPLLSFFLLLCMCIPLFFKVNSFRLFSCFLSEFFPSSLLHLFVQFSTNIFDLVLHRHSHSVKAGIRNVWKMSLLAFWCQTGVGPNDMRRRFRQLYLRFIDTTATFRFGTKNVGGFKMKHKDVTFTSSLSDSLSPSWTENFNRKEID